MSDLTNTTKTKSLGIEAYLKRVGAMESAGGRAGDRGRLIFALDATASREGTWDTACQLTADMFRECSNLDLQLVYYRGIGECAASGWVNNHEHLARLMSKIKCRSGETQIGKVLAHARKEYDKQKVGALVFIGDMMEEKRDQLAAAAALLGDIRVPVFMFQELEEGADDDDATITFREIAKLSGGAYCRFSQGSAEQLGELLRAAASYATGGYAALQKQQSKGATLLLGQLRA